MPSYMFLIILFIEFLPAMIAAVRRNRRFGKVFVLCIFSGTIICWFLALREALAPTNHVCVCTRPGTGRRPGFLSPMLKAFFYKEAFRTSYTNAYLFTRMTE